MMKEDVGILIAVETAGQSTYMIVILMCSACK